MALFAELMNDDLGPGAGLHLWWLDGVGLSAGADLLIAVASWSVFLGLVLFLRRRTDLRARWIFRLFAAFALLAGATHLVAAIALWQPLPALHDGLKLATAVVAVTAAALLWRQLPRALALPGPAQLAQVNARLRAETEQRRRREHELAELEGRLQGMVEERTAAIERANTELAQQMRQLTQADARKNRFLGVLAHELRSPLTPIRNAAFLLRECQSHAPEQVERSAALIEDQVRHMARLIDDLGDVQRIIGGQVELRREVVGARALLESAVQTVRPLLDEHGHRLELVSPPASVRMHVDPDRLRQVLINLLNNAALYTDPGGRITLGFALEGQDVVIRVRDNGTGFDPAQGEALFEMFVRSEHSAARVPSGLGLGLAVARRLVELHGGTVQAESAGLGTGSAFTVRLPGALSDEPAADPGVSRRGLAGLRVLVIDDHRLSADSLREALQHDGANARAVYTGNDALRALPSFRPHVLLLDLGLPDLPGEEVARRVRAQPGPESPRIIALSGYDEPARAGTPFDQRLLKPVELSELLRLLATVQP